METRIAVAITAPWDTAATLAGRLAGAAAWSALAMVLAATQAHAAELADVVSVRATGAAGGYAFAVGVRSPDRGCERYADWWEVLDEAGRLLYRRVLLHSHADEQPFVRSGGPVPVQPEQVVFVRAHMHPGGYGGTVFKGSVAAGFRRPDALGAPLPDHSRARPLPDGCAF